MDPADEPAEVIRPDFAFLKVVEERSGQAIRACWRVHGVRQLTAMFPSAKERGSDASGKGETG